MTAPSIILGLPGVAMIAGCMLVVVGVMAIRRPGLALICVFILFAFAWRLTSVFYIDLFGPVPSEQLETRIGPGAASFPLAVSQLAVLAAMLFSFRPSRLRQVAFRDHSRVATLTAVGRFNLSNLACLAIAFFLLALWLELIVAGPIPLFNSIERTDYLAHHAGPLHRRIIEWGPMLAFQLGLFFAGPALSEKPFDRRFGALFIVIMLYLFIAGHRFSSFYLYTSFFVIPLGAVMLQRQARNLSIRSLFVGAPARYLAVAGAGGVLLVIVALSRSYLLVRSSDVDLVTTKLSQRILVQQGEMWWMTYQRIFLQGDWDSALAFQKLFINPFDPARNSTMQFLMERALPLDRTHFILAQGSSYTGGWPEVFFELGGPVGGFALVALSAIAFSEFMFLIVRCFVQQRFVTCFFLTPILFALSVNIVSGMVNSFIQVTFVVKIWFALLAYVVEQQWRMKLMSNASPRNMASTSANAHDLTTLSSYQYIGGLSLFLFNALRTSWLLLLSLCLAVAVSIGVAMHVAPVTYSGETIVRIVKSDGLVTSNAQSLASRVNSAAFQQRVAELVNTSDDRNSKLLSAQAEGSDKIRLITRVDAPDRAHRIFESAIKLLDEDRAYANGYRTADIRTEFELVDNAIARFQNFGRDLAALTNSSSSPPSGNPKTVAMQKAWLSELTSRNDMRLARVDIERSRLVARVDALQFRPLVVGDINVLPSPISPNLTRIVALCFGTLLIAALVFSMIRRQGRQYNQAACAH